MATEKGRASAAVAGRNGKSTVEEPKGESTVHGDPSEAGIESTPSDKSAAAEKVEAAEMASFVELARQTHQEITDVPDELGKDELLGMYRMMYLIRRFETRAAQMYTQGKIKGFLHLYSGQEAVAVGSRFALTPKDYMITSYRDHGHALVVGMSAREVMAELFGKSTGCVGGKGGSMHMFSAEKRMMGGYAIVGGSVPISVGLALGCKYKNEGTLCASYFGDGATNQGAWHEGLNLSAVWKLPNIFVCENNFYGIGTSVTRSTAEPDIYKRASSYRMPGVRADGMNVIEVYQAMKKAAEHCRSGAGPYLIEFITYRFRPHSMSDPGTYRTKEEERFFTSIDPIEQMAEYLKANGMQTDDELKTLRKAVDAEVDDAVQFADESPMPGEEELRKYVYKEWKDEWWG